MISIIVPTRNEEKIIRTTLSSLKKQLTLDYELIVSDGESTDNTILIAHEFTDLVVSRDPAAPKNIAQGRNAGAHIARGEFLVFLDADCTIKNADYFFTHALKQFEDSRVVALAAPLNVLPELATYTDRVIESIIQANLVVVNNLLHTGGAQGEFQMVRASEFKKIGGYNERLVVCEDLDLFKRLARRGRTVFDTSLTVYHTGRRAHAIGWPHLLYLWFANQISVAIRGKAYSKEWEPLR